LEARRAMRALLADPDATEEAFRVISALSGNSGRRLLRRFRRTSTGARVLRDRTSLADVLGDSRRMAAMPAGSLGAALRDFYAAEELGPGDLVDASEAAFTAGPDGAPDGAADADAEIFGRRLRDLHDVFHVLTGYGRDLRGEAAVLAFTVPQTRNPGVAYIVWTALRRAGLRSEMGRLIRQALRRGLRSDWLPGKDWEGLLERPLDELREELRIGPPPQYDPVRSAGAPPISAGA
jgi:ubiquinone biosynthesis protein COQ4